MRWPSKISSFQTNEYEDGCFKLTANRRQNTQKKDEVITYVKYNYK